jgi:hypothetical protein
MGLLTTDIAYTHINHRQKCVENQPDARLARLDAWQRVGRAPFDTEIDREITDPIAA